MNKKKNKKIKSRNYIFTINNYTTKELKKIKKISENLDRHNYICFGLEVAPTTETKHVQGYIQLRDNQQYTFLHNYFNLQREKGKLKFHLQSARGGLKKNQEYTSKEKEWFEFGTPKKDSSVRSDIDSIRKKIEENPKDLDNIIRDNAVNFQTLKFAENIQKYHFKDREPDTPPKVFWIFGYSGIGKTRIINDTFKDICFVSDPKWPGTNYNQNEVLLFDDFRDGDMSFNMILRITDRYPFSLQFKGGSVKLNSPYIIFTSPESIKDTFFTMENIKQLKRRIVEIDLENEKKINLKNYKEKLVKEK